jgi:peptidoglycan hydrolase-like protein with peptidoglycan-binding domain
MISKFIGATALAITLAACGTNGADRTGGGAAAGAATGAGVGALGGPGGALAGAAIGGGAGAATGAFTSPDQVNLGTPPWSDPQTRVPGVGRASGGNMSGTAGGSSTASASEIRDVQQQLRSRGYNVGPVDGIYGPQTRSAMNRFQRDNNLQQTSRLDDNTMQMLTGSSNTGSSNMGSATSPAANPGDSRPDPAASATGQVGAPGSNASTGAGPNMGAGSPASGSSQWTGGGPAGAPESRASTGAGAPVGGSPGPSLPNEPHTVAPMQPQR